MANQAGREATIPDGDGENQGQLPASDVIRGAIASCGLSRGELSRRTGVNAATISRFMNRRSTITLSTFELLSAELGLLVVRLD